MRPSAFVTEGAMFRSGAPADFLVSLRGLRWLAPMRFLEDQRITDPICLELEPSLYFCPLLLP